MLSILRLGARICTSAVEDDVGSSEPTTSLTAPEYGDPVYWDHRYAADDAQPFGALPRCCRSSPSIHRETMCQS